MKEFFSNKVTVSWPGNKITMSSSRAILEINLKVTKTLI